MFLTELNETTEEQIRHAPGLPVHLANQRRVACGAQRWAIQRWVGATRAELVNCEGCKAALWHCGFEQLPATKLLAAHRLLVGVAEGALAIGCIRTPRARTR